MDLTNSALRAQIATTTCMTQRAGERVARTAALDTDEYAIAVTDLRGLETQLADLRREQLSRPDVCCVTVGHNTLCGKTSWTARAAAAAGTPAPALIACPGHEVDALPTLIAA